VPAIQLRLSAIVSSRAKTQRPLPISAEPRHTQTSAQTCSTLEISVGSERPLLSIGGAGNVRLHFPYWDRCRADLPPRPRPPDPESGLTALLSRSEICGESLAIRVLSGPPRTRGCSRPLDPDPVLSIRIFADPSAGWRRIALDQRSATPLTSAAALCSGRKLIGGRPTGVQDITPGAGDSDCLPRFAPSNSPSFALVFCHDGSIRSIAAGNSGGNSDRRHFPPRR